MRNLKKVSVFLLCMVFAFGAGIFIEKVMNSFYPNKNNIDDSTSILEEVVEFTEPVKTALQNEINITADTKLIIIEHDLNTGEEISTEKNVPTKYIGMDRETFIDEMKHYEKVPALSDIRRGFKSLAVISFSEKEIRLQKNYSKNVESEHFYIVSKDNKLVVYYDDMETVFLTTDILVESLPESVRLEILNKKYFENEEELYNFLESYSS